jgi:ribonucleoside-diphosphate reductase alpha chain
MFKKMGAREQFKAILVSLQGTSHPWLTWKDTINNRAINNNTGTIHLSNLCTEICLPQDADNVSVCNLASINLSSTWSTERWIGLIDESARVAVRQLDNLIDITRSSVAEADTPTSKTAPWVLGVMGFTDVIERFGYSYE